jgi:hypothetical protein
MKHILTLLPPIVYRGKGTTFLKCVNSEVLDGSVVGVNFILIGFFVLEIGFELAKTNIIKFLYKIFF